MPEIIAQFSIQYVQIINEHGALCAQLPTFANNTQWLTTIYRIMHLTRCFDEKAIALQRMGKLGTYAPCRGQEAIGAAIGHMLRPEDIFIPYYRDYAALAQRKVKWSEILSYWGGDERGNQFMHNAQDLPFSVPIASQCLHAAGIAFALQYRQEPRIALVSLGDGGTSEGDFYEAINIAGIWNLPLVFVINNNQWAISVPLQSQTKAATLAQKAIAAGFEGIQVDGNDPLAMSQVLDMAINKARNGNGPTLIEAISYRLSNHTTADDATRYQPQHEVRVATQREPIRRFKHFLEQHIQWTDAQEKTLLQECEQIIENEITEYLSKPPQALSSIFDYHFADMPENFIEQRATVLEASSCLS